MKNSTEDLQKIKTELPYDPTILLPPKKKLAWKNIGTPMLIAE